MVTRIINTMSVNYMYNFMFYMLFYQFMVLFAVFVVNAYKEVEKEIEEEEEEEEEEIKVLPYEDKYKDKLKEKDKLSEDKLTDTFLDNLKNSFVMETTPNGNVLMFWDNKRASFTYYSDTSIPYRYLEVVARKYVIMNNCREIYYIMEEQLKPLKKEEIVEKKEEKNVFAKLKSYNQSSIMDTKNIPQKKQNISTRLPTINIKKEYKNEILLKENSNRYSYEGKLVNFSFLKKPKKNNSEKISFSEFKKIQNSIK